MAYNDDVGYILDNPPILRGGVNSETITTNKTLTYSDSTYQLLKTTTGSLDVILPGPKDGASFWIKSKASSTSAIVVKDHNGGTVESLAAREGILVVATDTAWFDVINA